VTGGNFENVFEKKKKTNRKTEMLALIAK